MTSSKFDARAGTEYDAVFFDFDGVLVESLDVKRRAFIEIYRPYGVAIAERAAEHHDANRGMSRYEKFRLYHREFLGRELDEAGVTELASAFSKKVEDAVVACPEVPGAMATLEALQAFRPRLSLFVVSATPGPELERILHRRGIATAFDGAFGSPDSKSKIIHTLIRDRALAAHRCLMIGDSLADLEASREAGIDFLGRTSIPSDFPEGCDTVTDLTCLATRIGV
ncbi:MAG: HAD family hydrolase [Alphaproteobacteria bacterium]